jgi:hypothetical protein
VHVVQRVRWPMRRGVSLRLRWRCLSAASLLHALLHTTPGSPHQPAGQGADPAWLRGKISMLPGPNRFLRVIPGGLLTVERPRAKRWGVCSGPSVRIICDHAGQAGGR